MSFLGFSKGLADKVLSPKSKTQHLNGSIPSRTEKTMPAKGIFWACWRDWGALLHTQQANVNHMWAPSWQTWVKVRPFKGKKLWSWVDFKTLAWVLELAGFKGLGVALQVGGDFSFQDETGLCSGHCLTLRSVLPSNWAPARIGGWSAC